MNSEKPREDNSPSHIVTANLFQSHIEQALIRFMLSKKRFAVSCGSLLLLLYRYLPAGRYAGCLLSLEQEFTGLQVQVQMVGKWAKPPTFLQRSCHIGPPVHLLN